MDYYDKRRNAMLLIDKEYREGKNVNQIALKVGSMFGFGKRIVEERVKLLEEI